MIPALVLSAVATGAVLAALLAAGRRVPPVVAVAPLGLLLLPRWETLPGDVPRIDSEAARALVANLQPAEEALSRLHWLAGGSVALAVLLLLGALAATLRSAGPHRRGPVAIGLITALLCGGVASAQVLLSDGHQDGLPTVLGALVGGLLAAVGLMGGTQRSNAPEAAATAGLLLPLALAAAARYGAVSLDHSLGQTVAAESFDQLLPHLVDAATQLHASTGLLRLAVLPSLLLALLGLAGMASRERPLREALALLWLGLALAPTHGSALERVGDNLARLTREEVPTDRQSSCPTAPGSAHLPWQPAVVVEGAPPQLLLAGESHGAELVDPRLFTPNVRYSLVAAGSTPWSSMYAAIGALPPTLQLDIITTGAPVPLDPSRATTRFAVHLREDGYLITDTTAPGELPLLCEATPCAGPEAYPSGDLSRALWRLKKLAPEEQRITLDPAPGIPWQVVVDGVRALRHAAPQDEGGVSIPIFRSVSLNVSLPAEAAARPED